MMRKLLLIIILALFAILLVIPSDVRAALVQGEHPKIFQQIQTGYPNGDSTITDSLGTAYPNETPPTASFGTSAQSTSTTRTITHTPTRTLFQTTGFVTATSSYANTAAALSTASAMTLEAATRNSPLYTPGTPSLTETPTITSTSMPSWTPSPSITSFPTVITTPRVLQNGESKGAADLQTLLIGLGIVGLSCFFVVGIWYFRKKR